MDRTTVERNARLLVVEIFWAAIYIGAIAFNAAYLIRVGGTNFQVSLLTSIAALCNAALALPTARFLERRTNRKPWIVGSLTGARLIYLGMILVPLAPPGWQPIAILLVFTIFSLPAGFFLSGFLPMLADVIPIERRARIFGARNVVLGATTVVVAFGLGRWLDAAPFPQNYQLLYALAVVTGLISSVYFSRISIPPSPIAAATRERLTPARIGALLRRERSFVNLLINTFIFNIALWMATPLQPIFFVRELGASDGWLGAWLALISGGAIGGSLIWSRLIDRRGPLWALPRAAILSASYYALVALFPNLTLILLFALVWGLINPGVEISHLQTLLESCPPERRATYLGVFTLVMNTGFCITPLLVAPLTNLIGARWLLLALALLRLIGGGLFALNPVRRTVLTG